jgi:hypothetical protein
MKMGTVQVFKINKTQRHIGIAVLSVLIMAFGVLGFRDYNKPKVAEQPIVTLNYQIQTDMIPKVVLKANSIYPGNTLTQKDLIVNQLVSAIQSDLKLKITATPDAQIKGTVKKVVTVKSLYGEKAEVLWEKQVRNETSSLTGVSELSYEATFQDDLSKSRNYLDSAFLQTKLEPGSVTEIGYIYSGEVTKSGETLPFEGSQKVIVPMTLDVYRMEIKTTGELSGALTKAAEVPVSKVSVTQVVGLMGMALSALALLGLLFLTKVAKQKTAYNKEIESIFKLHGERLARLEAALPNQHANVISVNEIGDLIKISDEIRQPVFFYQVDEEDEEKIEFYVFDENRIYYLVKFGENPQNIETFIKRTA